MLKRCVVYIRVSFSDQIEGYSLANQEKSCRDLAVRDGYEVVKMFSDKGISAKTIDARPGLLDLLSFVKNKNNNIHACIIYHSSRISRDTKDWLFLRSLFSKLGILLISGSEPMISGRDPVSVFVSTILGANNQLDNDMRSANVKRGMRSKFLEGLPTGKIPLGYVHIHEKHTPPAIDPVWYPILKTIWLRIIDEKLTIGRTVEELNSLKLKTFSRQAVSRIFSDKFYTGIIHSETYQEEVQGKHQPMITLEQYYQVRAIFNSRKPNNYGIKRKKLRDDFMLKGILRCPCGRHLTACYSKGSFAYYLCSSRSHKVLNIPRDRLEKEFMEILKLIKPKPARMNYYVQLIREKYRNRYTLANEAHDQLVRDIDQLGELIKKVREKNLRGIYSDSEYLDMKSELESQLFAKKAALSDRKFEVLEIDELINFMIHYLNHLDLVFLKASPEDRIKIAGSIFPKKLIIENGNIQTVILGRQYYQIGAPNFPCQSKYPVPDSNRR